MFRHKQILSSFEHKRYTKHTKYGKNDTYRPYRDPNRNTPHTTNNKNETPNAMIYLFMLATSYYFFSMECQYRSIHLYPAGKYPWKYRRSSCISALSADWIYQRISSAISSAIWLNLTLRSLKIEQYKPYWQFSCEYIVIAWMNCILSVRSLSFDFFPFALIFCLTNCSITRSWFKFRDEFFCLHTTHTREYISMIFLHLFPILLFSLFFGQCL